MHKIIFPSTVASCSDKHAKWFDNQMIKRYPIIKSTEFLAHLLVPNVESPLSMYTCKAAEDNARCFQELKHIVQGTEAEVYVDEFNIHSVFCAVWRKL